MYLQGNYFVLPRYKCSYQLSLSAFCQRGAKMPWQICGVFSSHALGDRSEVAFFAQSITYIFHNIHISVIMKADFVTSCHLSVMFPGKTGEL